MTVLTTQGPRSKFLSEEGGGVIFFWLRYFYFIDRPSLTAAKLIAENILLVQMVHNPLTPMSDQNRFSPYNFNAISRRQVIGIKKYS